MSDFLHKNRIALLAAAILLAAFGYFLWWRDAMTAMERQIGALTGMPAPPFALSGGAPARAGFPYRIEISRRDATLTRSRPDYQLRLTTPELLIDRQPWRANPTVLFLDRPLLTLTPRGPATPVALRIVAGRGRASVHADRLGVQRLSLVFEHGDLLAPAVLGADAVHFDRLEFHGRERAALTKPERSVAASSPGPPTADVFLELLIEGAGVRIGASPDRLELFASLGVTSDPRVAPGKPFLEPWRQAGGTLELYALQLSSGGKSLFDTRATLALDERLRPLGSGTVSSVCPAEALRLLGLARAAPAGRQEAPAGFSLRLERGRLVLADAASPIKDAPARSPAAPCPGLRR